MKQHAIPDGLIDLDSEPAKVLGFTDDKFEGYMWKLGNYIMVSLIVSKDKGNFRSLVERILSLGLGVKIPTPMGDMKRIVQNAGYKKTFEYDPKSREGIEVWVLEPVGTDNSI